MQTFLFTYDLFSTYKKGDPNPKARASQKSYFIEVIEVRLVVLGSLEPAYFVPLVKGCYSL